MKSLWLPPPFLMLAACSIVLAGEFERFEFQPFTGGTVSGRIPLVSDDNVRRGSIRVNSSYNLGASLAVNLNELDAVEAHWQRQFSEGRLPAGNGFSFPTEDSTAFNLNIDQLHCNFLHHYVTPDPKTFPYVMGGLGATTYRANGSSRSHFSFALGGGVKYFFTNRVGIRGEARWSPTLLSGSGSDFWCRLGGAGAACRIRLKTSLQHQLDLTGGIVFRF